MTLSTQTTMLGQWVFDIHDPFNIVSMLGELRSN